MQGFCPGREQQHGLNPERESKQRNESPLNTNTNTPECGKRTQSLNPIQAKAFKTTTDGEEILTKIGDGGRD